MSDFVWEVGASLFASFFFYFCEKVSWGVAGVVFLLCVGVMFLGLFFHDPFSQAAFDGGSMYVKGCGVVGHRLDVPFFDCWLEEGPQAGKFVCFFISVYVVVEVSW